MEYDFIKEGPRGITLSLKILTRAGRCEIVGVQGSSLKIRLVSPPVGGKANEELISLLSERLGVKRQGIRIIRGLSSRNKVVEIEGLTKEETISLLSLSSPLLSGHRK